MLILLCYALTPARSQREREHRQLQFVVNLVSIQVAVAHESDKLKFVGRYLISDQKRVS